MGENLFSQWVLEGTHVTIPKRLLEKMQSLDLVPENLGYLILAMAKSQENISGKELAKDKWVRWCLAEGWALWEGQGEEQKLTFSPLWKRLYRCWEETERKKDASLITLPGEFNYGKILKWLDQTRGTLSVTVKEKQIIQEFNLKYGWSTDFILIFLQLSFERAFNQVHTYQNVAKRVYENGINTVDGLVNFMNNLDWIQFKVGEVKKCIGQYGGVTRPQREMYLKWNKQWNMGHELIMRAANETVRTNNPSFKYIDGVLQDWYEKGVTNVKEAEKVLAERDKRSMPPKKTINSSKRYSRVDPRDWEKFLDYE